MDDEKPRVQVGPDYKLPIRMICPSCGMSDGIAVEMLGLHRTICRTCQVVVAITTEEPKS